MGLLASSTLDLPPGFGVVLGLIIAFRESSPAETGWRGCMPNVEEFTRTNDVSVISTQWWALFQNVFAPAEVACAYIWTWG